jgi:hypothetical protein
MPASITVTRKEGDTFRVEIREGASSTSHDVVCTEEQRRRFGGDATAERLVEASFRFLLEREPKESILRRFELPVIARYFPEYPREIGKLL